MLKILIDDLILETTRRCNMRCEHCLRGDAENMNLDTSFIEAVLSRADSVCSVVFSGGEPSLAVPTIREFYRLAEEYRCIPSNFYVATNGKEHAKELAHILIDAWTVSDDKDCCAVCISKDLWHEKLTETNPLEALAFYRDDKDHTNDKPQNKTDWPWCIGRAADYGIGRKPNDFVLDPSFQGEITKDGRDTILRIETLYLSCNGYLYGNCDLSYERMDSMPYEEPENCLKVWNPKAAPWGMRLYERIAQKEGETL